MKEPIMDGCRVTRREFLATATKTTAGLALGAALVSCGGPGEARSPNVVVVLTDDQGWGDVGVYGAKGYETPNLDRMAADGIRFTQFYVSQAVCSASRASLLTGCYAERVGIQGALGPYSTVGISAEEETIAEVLKARGYATGCFGKWHLGHQPQFSPLKHGFDEFLGLPYSNDMWPVDYDGTRKSKWKKGLYPELPLIDGETKIAEIRTLEDQTTLTTRYTERAVSFIEKNADRPFFLYLPHSMPHVPLGVSEKFRGQSEQGAYGDVMMEIDWSVGRIMEALEKHGLAKDTLVVFVSDNGPWLNFGNHAGSTAGLREGKGTMWEGGARVPCIMRWPGRIPAGSVSHGIAATIDLLPTIAAATGAALPDAKIDGIDLSDVVFGGTGDSPRDHYFYYYEGGLRAVREGRWKLLFPHRSRSYRGVEPGKDGMPGPTSTWDSGLELYDLEKDPAEKMDLAAEHPEIVKRLQALAERARADLGDRLTGAKGRGVRPPGRLGSDRQLEVEHLAVGKVVALAAPPHAKYTGGGEGALANGRRGTADHTDGTWQGFEATDLDATIDLGGDVVVKEVVVGVLASQLSWIFAPKSVEVFVSKDGETFVAVGRTEDESPKPGAEARIEEIRFEFPPRPVRKVRVVAKNVGRCPEWHPGAGGKAWVFVDEIEVR
ncbi:MAG: sulfatase [Planctomycetota bacterium]